MDHRRCRPARPRAGVAYAARSCPLGPLVYCCTTQASPPQPRTAARSGDLAALSRSVPRTSRPALPQAPPTRDIAMLACCAFLQSAPVPRVVQPFLIDGEHSNPGGRDSPLLTVATRSILIRAGSPGPQRSPRAPLAPLRSPSPRFFTICFAADHRARAYRVLKRAPAAATRPRRTPRGSGSGSSA